jgi:hypothetical protein
MAKKEALIDKQTISDILFSRQEINNIILDMVKKDGRVVYGSKAMNVQIHPYTRRFAPDYDVISPTPRRDAIRLKRKLNNRFGNNFYVKEAIHKGTWKVKHVGAFRCMDTDDIGVADFSESNNIPTKKIGGTRYEKLSNIVRKKKEILKDKESKYRHDKDKKDLNRIRLSKHFTRSGVKI